MAKSQFISIPVEKNLNRELQNVESISFSNMKAEEVILTLNNGIARTLPPAQLVSGTLVPVPFVIQGVMSVFDVTFSIKFPNPTGKVIVDYLQNNS